MASPTPELPASPAPAAPHPDAVTQTLALIQPWIDYIPRQQRRLGLFIFLALLLYLTTFLFITIDTTRAELHRPVHMHVSMESAPTPSLAGSSTTDDYWDQLSDPRLFLLPRQGQSSGPVDLPATVGTSIDSNLSSNQLPPPAAPEDFRFAHPILPPLEQRIGDSLHPDRQPFAYGVQTPPNSGHTTWQMDATLAQRQPTGLPSLPAIVSDTELNPTELRIAVGPGGDVEHVLVEQSCDTMGSPSAQGLDQQAALAARKIHFQSVDQPGLVWGRLTVFWSYAPKPREEILPTPPSSP